MNVPKVAQSGVIEKALLALSTLILGYLFVNTLLGNANSAHAAELTNARQDEQIVTLRQEAEKRDDVIKELRAEIKEVRSELAAATKKLTDIQTVTMDILREVRK